MDILDEIYQDQHWDIPRHEDVLREERDEMDGKIGREVMPNALTEPGNA